MEMKIIDGKFWIFENSADENNIERFVYDDEKSAINRLKEIMKTVDTSKLSLSSVDITTKEWKISGVSWAIIATGIIRGESEGVK